METMSFEGIPLYVKKAVVEIDNNAQVILFGSRARGESSGTSDWDFLIISKNDVTSTYQDKIREVLYKIELDTGQIISSVIENDLIWSRYINTDFYKNVVKEGIEIKLPKAA